MLLLSVWGLASTSCAQVPPFYPRSTKANQDLGGLNQNFDEVSGQSVNNLTQTVTPSSCATGQYLSPSFYNNGTIRGGVCVAIIFASSTTAAIPQKTGTNTTFSACLSGSTVAVTVPPQGGSVMAVFSGHMITDTYPNAGPELTLEIDGAFPSGYGSTNGIVYGGASANVASNMSFSFVTDKLSSGSHSFCLAARAQAAATWTFSNAGDPGTPRFTVLNLGY